MKCLHCDRKSMRLNSSQSEDGKVTRYRRCSSGHRLETVEYERRPLWAALYALAYGLACRMSPSDLEAYKLIEAVQPFLGKHRVSLYEVRALLPLDQRETLFPDWKGPKKQCSGWPAIDSPERAQAPLGPPPPPRFSLEDPAGLVKPRVRRVE